MNIIQTKNIGIIETVSDAVIPDELRVLLEDGLIKINCMYNGINTIVYGFKIDIHIGYLVFQDTNMIGHYGNTVVIDEIIKFHQKSLKEIDPIPTQCIVQQIKLADATKYPLDQIIFVDMSGKMYMPQTIQEVEDEVHSPILQCVLAVSHSREKTKLHWDNKGQIKLLETL